MRVIKFVASAVVGVFMGLGVGLPSELPQKTAHDAICGPPGAVGPVLPIPKANRQRRRQPKRKAGAFKRPPARSSAPVVLDGSLRTVLL
jgi:hypothetical protein